MTKFYKMHFPTTPEERTRSRNEVVSVYRRLSFPSPSSQPCQSTEPQQARALSRTSIQRLQQTRRSLVVLIGRKASGNRIGVPSQRAYVLDTAALLSTFPKPNLLNMEQENQAAFDAIAQDRQACLAWIDQFWLQVATVLAEEEEAPASSNDNNDKNNNLTNGHLTVLPPHYRHQDNHWLSKLLLQPQQCCFPSDEQPKAGKAVEVLSTVPPSLLSPILSTTTSDPNDDNSRPTMLRPLAARELEVLEQNGCILDYAMLLWLIPQSLNLVATVAFLRRHVRHTNFSGTVVLIWPMTATATNHIAKEETPQSPSPPAGLYHNAQIGPNVILHLTARVAHNHGSVANTVIGKDATLVGCGDVTTTEPWSPHVLSEPIDVGPEANGSRALTHLTAEATLPDVVRQLTTRRSRESGEDNGDKNSAVVKSNDIPPTTHWNVIGRGAQVQHVTTIHNVFLHGSNTTTAAARITGAAAVAHATLFPNAHIGTACHASHVALQWHAAIDQGSHVTNALLMERSHVGPRAHVHHCIIGPDAALARGECHASVLGPCFAAHHQSLVISQMAWNGRCNVGYGANVGSNHTGRAPDQECIAGEGIFWGLSSVIVYPVNLARAHYSLVAAGTKLMPQQISLPFSLIINHSTNSSGGNEIVPGWVLKSTPYTLARCDMKYQTRQKAQHHAHYTRWPLLDRSDVLRQVYKARYLLQTLTRNQQRNGKWDKSVFWYNDNDNAADAVTQKYLGKCRLSENMRKKAITIYTDCLQRSALLALLSWLEDYYEKNGTVDEANEDEEDLIQALKLPSSEEQTEMQAALQQLGSAPEWPDIPWESNSDETWDFQKFILTQEFDLSDYAESGHVARAAMANLLHERLQKLEQHFVAAVIQSKHRDDKRGSSVIPGYEESHVLVPMMNDDEQQHEDKVIRHVQQEARLCRERANKVIALLHPDQRLS